MEEISILQPGAFVRQKASRHTSESRPGTETQPAHHSASASERRDKEVQDRIATENTMVASKLALVRKTFGVRAAGDEPGLSKIPDCAWVPMFFYMVTAVGFVICLVTGIGVMRSSKDPEGEPENDNEGLHTPSPTPIGDDLFGLVLASMVRNMWWLSRGSSRKGMRLLHILTCVSLLIVNMTLQVYVLYFMNMYVAGSAMENIRRQYDDFEEKMYSTLKTSNQTSHGYDRGRPEFFQPEAFANLDDSVKGTMCHFPLSEPLFFITILMVWTLTCVQDIRACFEHLFRFMINTPTCDSMSNSMLFLGGETKSETRTLSVEDDIQTVEVVGLTVGMKFFVAGVQIMPRLIVALLSLWLGCTWLCATADFPSLICNVVALAFVLQLKDLVYASVSPEQSKREAELTMVQPLYLQGSVSFMPYYGSFGWLVVSLIWVLCFIFYLQPVLPLYKWDIRAVCEPYLLSLTRPETQIEAAARRGVGQSSGS